MPQQTPFDDRPERRYDETVDPQNPPQSVVGPAARRTAVVSYVGILVAAFIIAGAGLLFWSVRDDGFGSSTYGGSEDPGTVGTSGERMPREGSPGGFDPSPEHDSTSDEIEFRGGGEPAQGPMPPLSAQGRVELRDVQVERAEGDTFWVRDGNESVAVVTAGDTPTVRAGQRVDVIGRAENNDSERRIRATRVDVK